MFISLRCSLAISVSLCFNSPLVAALVTNSPVADTYFEGYGSEKRNFGSAPVLRIDQWGGRQAFLRFTLPRLEHRLVKATLRLYITELGFNEQGEFPDLKTCLGLYDVVTPWTESGLTYNSPDGQQTWNQGPGLPGAKYTDVGPLPKPDFGVHLRRHAIPFDPARLRQNSWLELQLTDFVQERSLAGDKELNLLLRSSTLGRNYSFASREGREDQHPQLVIETHDTLPPVTEPQTSPEVAELARLAVPPHPRLYVTRESLARLRQTGGTGTRVAKAFINWVEAGSRSLSQGKFHDMGMHEGCENNALAWLITNRREFLSNSIAYAQLVLKKPMREHFEDVHAATFLGASWVHAMAVHYDWCFAELSSEHKQAVVGWLKEAADWGYVRSGAPIAHNDGGARQCLLGSAALALLGDDPEAPELYRRSRENFERNLLPWLNDGGRGGRSGDGGEYEGLHAFYIVKYAWMSQTATGVDVFSESPFFFNRLRHVLFGWYPRRLVEKDAAFSMRQYYSPSGDHIRLGYVGDTQPYQSAAALCARYREVPAAQAVRWLAGDWPTQWMQYTLRWAVLGEWDSISAVKPPELTASELGEHASDITHHEPSPLLLTSSDSSTNAPVGLAYLDQGCNTVYLRSDWSDDATWILFENAPFVSIHGSLDSGTFEIFKGDLLAARTGNLDYANVGAPHVMNYLHRTVAGNCLLIHDPNEKWKGFLGGAEGGQDGGGQRTDFPLGGSPDAATYLNYRDVFQRGQITRFKHAPEFTYALADLTPAYNHPKFHAGKLNQAKVTNVSRELLYLRELDTLLVFDRIQSTRPEFKKTWLLHSLGDLEVLDGRATKVDDGEFHYTGATRAVIRYGWPKPVPSFGRCLSVTLLPEKAELTKIGGRTELPPGKTEAFPGDRWHGQHAHHHLKDFWVNGTNYPPGDPPETRWFGEPTSKWFVPGTPDESGGRGKWRIEVSPEDQSSEAVFFHALCPRLGRDGGFPEVTRIGSEASAGSNAPAFEGALVSENNHRAAVFFAPGGGGEAVSVKLPPALPLTLIVADLAAGQYSVRNGSHPSRDVEVGADGILLVRSASGVIDVSKRGGSPK